MDTGSHQRGQVLVIFTGALLVLLLIGALVIDLGMSWMLRRQEQNAVDPGALAAAKFVAGDSTYGATTQMVEAACHYARAAGFFPSATGDDGCVAANDPESAVLTVNYPPVGPSAGGFAGRFGFVQVGITRTHPNFLWRIFGVPVSTVSASAVAANTSGDSNSYSLLALDPNSDSASGKIGGTGGGSSAKVSIVPATDPSTGNPYQGGYVQVNSTYGGVASAPTLVSCQAAGTNGTGALQVTGGSSITAPAIFVTGTCAENNNATITTSGLNDDVTQGALQVGDPLAELQPPDPSAYPPGQCGVGGPTTAPTGPGSKGCGGGSMAWAGTACIVDGVSSTCVTLSPGTYYGGWQISNNITLQLDPGIYIMAGGGIKLNSGGSITSVQGGSGTPAPVMIFSTDNPVDQSACIAGTASSVATQCQGAIDLEAQATLDLAALDSGPYKGILLWQDGYGSCTQPTASCNVTIGGQVNMSIAGTVYAPKVQVTLTGGGAVGGTAAIQIISWQWTIGGGSNLTMPYDPNQLYHLEQRGLVH